MNACPVDYILTGGDWDFLLKNLVEANGDPAKFEPGIWYRGAAGMPPQQDSGAILNTGRFQLNHDLNSAPWIDRDLVHWELYAKKNGNFVRSPGTYIMSGRDCWHAKCTFCSWTTLYPTYRTRDPIDVVSEIEMLVTKYGVKEIMDDSGSFPVGSWLTTFCNELIRRGLPKKLRIDCNMRFGRLTYEDYSLMRKAGFRLVLFGVESANQETLDRFCKALRVEDVEKGAAWATKAGLAVHLTFMFGHAWEGPEEIANTVKLARRLLAYGHAATLQCTLTIPYPGTPLFRELKDSDGLTTLDWDEYDQRRAITKTPRATEDEIKAAIRSVYAGFLQPRCLWHILCRNLFDVKFYYHGFQRLVGHLLDFRGTKKACGLLLAVFCAFSVWASAYDIGKDMEAEAFWRSDPVLFVKRHQEGPGFKFTSDAREQADSRRDGGVVWQGLEVYETRITFGERGGVDRVEIVLYNTGGTEKIETLVGADGKKLRRLSRVDKRMSAEDFKTLVRDVQAKLTPEGAKNPSVDRSRLKNTDVRQFAQTWPKTDLGTVATLTWNYEKGVKKTDELKPGFVRLAVDGPARTARAAAKGKASASRTGGGASVRSKKLSANVHTKDSRGDVYVDNIPMVDQGAKGYCAAAASERILRYFGTTVDEHEIAAAAGTTAEGGTSVDKMVETVRTLGRRYRFAVQTVAGDAGESTEARIANLGKRVDQYNKTAKRLKKPQISEDVYVRREGNMLSYSPGAVDEAMDPEVKKEMKTNGPGKAKFQAFLKTVRKNVDIGQPLLWGVTLGIYPEGDLPQARGGHMRLIIGYNDKKGEILFSDTWGRGHELKRMPADWAWTITDTLLAVRPL